MVAHAATYIQRAFRGRNDDGSETAATWIAAENTDWTQQGNGLFRVRFGVRQDTSNADTNLSKQFKLKFSHNGGAFVDLGAQGAGGIAVRYGDSTHLTDDEVTTEQLLIGNTFVAGRVIEVAPTGTITFPSGQRSLTEIEAVIEIVAAEVAQDDTIVLRVYESNDTALSTYEQFPTITIGTAAPPTFTGSLNVTEQDDTLAASGSTSDYAVFRRTPQTGAVFDPDVDTPIARTALTAYTDPGVSEGDYDYQVFAWTGAWSAGSDVVQASVGAGAGITGSLAVTEQDDTLSASGTFTAPTVTGSLAVTEQDDTLAASGTFTAPVFTGSVAVTEADDTLDASGTFTAPVFTGTLAVTEVDDTLSAAGTHTPPVFTGSLAVTEQDDTLAASGTVTSPSITGSLAVTEQDDTLAASGTSASEGIVGSLNVTEQDDTLAAAGTFTPPPVTGTLDVTEAPDTLAAAGTHTPPTFTGNVAADEDPDVLAASGTFTPPVITGTLNVVEDDDTLAASGTGPPPEVLPAPLILTDEDVRPARFDDHDRPARWHEGSRPARFDDHDRPARFHSHDRPRVFPSHARPARFALTEEPVRFFDAVFVRQEVPVELDIVPFGPYTEHEIGEPLFVRVLETLRDETTKPLELHNQTPAWTATVSIEPPEGAVVSRGAVIVDPASLPIDDPDNFPAAEEGWVRIDWQQGDFATAGSYKVQLTLDNGTLRLKSTAVWSPQVNVGPASLVGAA